MILFNKKDSLGLAYQQINFTVYDTVVANLTIFCCFNTYKMRGSEFIFGLVNFDARLVRPISITTTVLFERSYDVRNVRA